MLPSIDVRIANIVKALEQVIMPALPARERLARDQIRLCLGHLHMIGEQWRHAGAFEAAALGAMVELGEELIAGADARYAEDLRAALAAAKGVGASDHAGVAANIGELGGVIDRIILGDDGKVPLSEAAREAILAYGEKQATRERTWFAMTGLDPDRKNLTDIATMMAEIAP